MAAVKRRRLPDAVGELNFPRVNGGLAWGAGKLRMVMMVCWDDAKECCNRLILCVPLVALWYNQMRQMILTVT